MAPLFDFSLYGRPDSLFGGGRAPQQSTFGQEPGRITDDDWMKYNDPYHLPRNPNDLTAGFQEPPAYLSDVFPDQAAFDASYGAMAPEFRPFYLSTLKSTFDAAEKRRKAMEGGLAELDTSIGNVGEQFEGWQNDPSRAAAIEGWTRMADPSYSIVSPRQEAAYSNILAGNYARASGRAAEMAGARGTMAGGSAIGHEASIQAQTDAAGLQLGASIDQANEQGRRQALSNLGSLAGASEQIDLAYTNLQSGLERNKALILASEEYVPTDHMAFAQLNFAMDAYDEMLRQMSEDEKRFEEATRLGAVDMVNLALAASGTGAFRWIAAMLGG